MNFLLAVTWVILNYGVQQALGAISEFATNSTTLKATMLNSATYDPKVRPEDKMTVQVRFNLLAINDLNIKAQQLRTSGWLTLKWTDTRLQWNPIGNPAFFFDNDLAIWIPELMVDNSVSTLGIIHNDNILLRVRYDGVITWEPTGIFYTSCNVDITYYPFDRQRCLLELTSWAYNINEVNLTFLSTGINLQDYSVNGEWDLVRTGTTRSEIVEEGEIFSQLDFILVTHRRTTYYILNIVLPTVLTSVLSVVVFVLPFESGEKVSYALTVLLSYTVLMTIVAAEMPAISTNVSILGVYLAMILIVGATATILTVINLYIYHQHVNRKVPQSLRTFTKSFLCKVSSWRKLDNKPPQSAANKVLPETPEKGKNKDSEPPNNLKHQKVWQDEESKDQEESKEEEFYSWIEIAMMFDVFYYRLFAVFVLLITIVFMVLLPLGGLFSK